jgi:hypothetical protein
MNRRDDAAEFERWLDRELPRAVAGELDAVAPPPLAIPGRRGAVTLGLRGAVAVIAVVLAVAVLATGTPNPVKLGHQVVDVVSVGSIGLQRTPVPTPDPPPAGAQPQHAGDGGGGASADRSDGSTDGAKPASGAASPSPGPDHTPKGQADKQRQNQQRGQNQQR